MNYGKEKVSIINTSETYNQTAKRKESRMENEKTSIIGEWSHNYKDYPTPALVLDGKLRDYISGSWSNKTEFLVDTGYDGEIMLAYDLYLALKYDDISIPEQEWGVGQTISGEILTLHSTETLIKIQEITFNVMVESSPLIDENLIGRAFINKFISINNGYRSIWSLLRREGEKQ